MRTNKPYFGKCSQNNFIIKGVSMKKWMIITVLFSFFASINLFAANTPIQRIDVVNLLWNSAIGGSGGVTPTSVQVVFQNSNPKPCLTTTLPFQGAITVWAGIGQTCVTPVTSVTITPVASVSSPVPVYVAPANPTTSISSTYYSTQIMVSQNIAPIFDPNAGALLSVGVFQVTATSHLG
jgi:hypothetical protein